MATVFKNKKPWLLSCFQKSERERYFLHGLYTEQNWTCWRFCLSTWYKQ